MMRIRIFLCLAPALLVAACQSAPTKSGFLKSYSHLEANPEYKSDLVYIKPGVDMRGYHYLLIDPVQIHLASDSLAAEFGPDVLEKVAQAFTRILKETIDPYYTVVDKPGDNVLRVRLAISDVEPTGSEVVRQKPSVGTAAMEGELLDSLTGEQLAAVVDRIESSAQGAENVPELWRPVEGAFREWAQRLLDFMDSYHEPAE